MISRLRSAYRNLGIAAPADLFSRIGHWWLAEFLALFPPRFAVWLAGRDRKAVVVSPEGDYIVLCLQGDGRQLLRSAQVDRVAYSTSSIDEFLAGHRLRRADVDVGVRLPERQYFHRTFQVPLEASRSIATIAEQDLIRKTPFRLDQIYHDFTTSRATKGKILVTQWVALRSVADDVAGTLELPLETVTFLDASTTDATTPPPLIRLRHNQRAGNSWPRVIGLALVLAAFLMAIAGTGLKLWQQEVALDDLESQLAVVKPRAQQVRALVNTLEHKQAVALRIHTKKREAARLLDVWEEATRILPNHTWLTELRLSETPDKHEQNIVVTGYSTAAPSLVGLIDASPMFSDASLTSPIARDNAEERERFSIQAKIQSPTGGRQTP